MKIEAMSNSLNKIVIESLVRYYIINSVAIVLILYRQEDFKRVM